MADNIDWPLYGLADYENGGSLLEFCRSNLSATTFKTKLNECHLTIKQSKAVTSGYHTDEYSSADEQQDSIVAPVLHWHQLIGVWESKTDAERQHLSSFRCFIQKVCLHTMEQVRAYLTNLSRSAMRPNQPRYRARGASKSFQQADFQAIGKPSRRSSTASARETGSVSESDLSPAGLRRLSWRRKLILNKLQLEPVSLAESKKLHLNVIESAKPNANLSVIDYLINDGLEFGNQSHKKMTSIWCQDDELKRGRYGESLVHVLIVNQTNEHLLLLIILLELCPLLIADVFKSIKFKGLSLLHLSIAYANYKLLKYLIDRSLRVAPQMLDSRVSGSLFRSPQHKSSVTSRSTSSKDIPPGLIINRKLLVPLKNGLGSRRVQQSSPGSRDPSKEATYWCDRMQNWPTANGLRHLILFDKLNSTLGKEGNIIYFGDSPLKWSISFQSRSMFDLIMRLTKSLNINLIDQRDADGNTCLHLLVINQQTGWLKYLAKSNKASLQARNDLGLSPLQLACHLGSSELFEEFLELSSVEFWSYSMIRCCGYPLNELDSLISNREHVQSAKHNSQSAMSIILESQVSSDEQKSQLLSSPVVKKLLEEKWRIFARRLFYHELFMLLLHLVLMTVAISLRPMLYDNDNNNNYRPATQMGSYWASFLEDRQRLVSLNFSVKFSINECH